MYKLSYWYTKLFSKSGFDIQQLTNYVDLFRVLFVVIVVAVIRNVR